MSKSKTGTNIFVILFKSIMIYIKNFLPLSRVMIFPVFGQIIGIFLIFYPTYLYKENYLAKLSGENLEQNLLFILLGLILIIIPGFAIFLKAFWDYMISMVSLNTMAFDIVKKGSFGDFKIHNNSVKLKTNNYVILLLVMTLFWLMIFIFPFLSFFLGFFVDTTFIPIIFLLMITISLIFSVILGINFSLCFQVFAFESITPVDIIKRSWNLMKGNFWRTLFMGIILFIITSIIVPLITNTIVERSPLLGYLMTPFESYVNLFSKNYQFTEILSKYNMTSFGLSMALALGTLGTVMTNMMLPLGSACFTLLYFDIFDRKKTKVPKS